MKRVDCSTEREATEIFVCIALSVVAGVAMSDAALAQSPTDGLRTKPSSGDGGKRYIELPVKGLIDSPRALGPRDLSKMGIEGGAKSMIRGGSLSGRPTRVYTPNQPSTTATMSLAPTAIPVATYESSARLGNSSASTNLAGGKVATGLVSWCKDQNEAMSRSARSGKPLLVFHMMGQLDDRFC